MYDNEGPWGHRGMALDPQARPGVSNTYIHTHIYGMV
jgi:hypothetical protein